MTPTKKKSFEALIQDNRARLVRICRIYARRLEDQEDLFQEITYQIWKSMDNFRGDSKPETYLYRIALNTALLFKNRQKKKPSAIEIDKAHDLGYQSDVHEEMDKADKMSWIHRAILTLKPIEQSLILLYLEDMSYEEIAGITGLKANHVGVKLNRIKKKLSEKVKVKE